MQPLIYKKPRFQFPPHHIPSNSFLLKARKNRNEYLRIPQNEFHYTSRTVKLFSATAPQSLSYGGWDDPQLGGDSVNSGESNQLYSFLSSIGIADKKYVFVYLFGFVCALAISRVKVSTIMLFPASGILFALGFSVGLVKGGNLKEKRLNEDRKKIMEENFRGLIEKLRNLGANLKGYNTEVSNLKNCIRRCIGCNQVTVSDLEGFFDVIESADISLGNRIELVESCIQSALGGDQENEGVSNHDSRKRSKKSVDKGLHIFQYFNGLFGWKFGRQVERSIKVNMDSPPNRALGNKRGSMLDNRFDSTVRTENIVGMENVAVENDKRNAAEINGTAKADFDQTIYTYRSKTSKFVKNQKLDFEDYQDEIGRVSSHTNSYNSMDVSISMNQTASSFGNQQKHETVNRNYSHLEINEEDQQEYYRRYYTKRPSCTNQESSDESVFGPSQSSVLGNDLEFNSYLLEANDLLKEAKGCLTKQADDYRAEHALQKSEVLLSKALEVRPMSLLAVGQLGNTYLLHGELKLRRSRELRFLHARADPLFDQEWGKVLKKVDDKVTNKDEITSALVNVCEECEELLIKAGRKYKLAVSIDGNDMRALYNWGVALTFHAQLIADIGPGAARDADKIFLAAIDKFDAMMSKSNVYAPDALFRWGAALQYRSRLRPSRSREKVKLLKQARRLYEDALHMDSGNRPLQEALSSCNSELDHWYGLGI